MHVYVISKKQLPNAIAALIKAGNGQAATQLLQGHNWLNAPTYTGISQLPINGLAKWQIRPTCPVTAAALTMWATMAHALGKQAAQQAMGKPCTHPQLRALFNGQWHAIANYANTGYWLFNMPANQLPPMPGI
jgi:hypothetical protein